MGFTRLLLIQNKARASPEIIIITIVLFRFKAWTQKNIEINRQSNKST